MDTKLRISAHAWKRCSQRSISLSDLLTALEIGRKIYRSNTCYFFVGVKDLPHGTQLDHLAGITIVCEGNEIISAWRNKNSLSKIKRRAKRYNGSRRGGHALARPKPEMTRIAA